MKIELMNLLVNELNDIDTIKNMISIYDNIPEEDIKKILDEAKKCGYNGNALKLATDKDVLEQRTIEEQIKLMEELKECEYNDSAFEIATLKNVLENRTTEDQIQLMKELKECEYNDNALEIATDAHVLENRTTKEQIQLMYTMHTLEKCKYRYGAFEIAIDKNVLENRTTDEQIQLMNSYVKKGELTHSDNLNKINDLKELKKYVCNLQKVYGNDTDIKIKDVVKFYK